MFIDLYTDGGQHCADLYTDGGQHCAVFIDLYPDTQTWTVEWTTKTTGASQVLGYSGEVLGYATEIQGY